MSHKGPAMSHKGPLAQGPAMSHKGPAMSHKGPAMSHFFAKGLQCHTKGPLPMSEFNIRIWVDVKHFVLMIVVKCLECYTTTGKIKYIVWLLEAHTPLLVGHSAGVPRNRKTSYRWDSPRSKLCHSVRSQERPTPATLRSWEWPGSFKGEIQSQLV